MKKIQKKWLAGLFLILPLLASALEFDQVKEFDEVFNISAQAVSRQRVEVSWEIAEGYYLYNNKFLSFSTDTPNVVIGNPDIPAGERQFDELLGEEVVKYHGLLTIGLPLEAIPDTVSQINLRVRSQGCLESVLCYPPTYQLLTVILPAASASSLAALPLSSSARISSSNGADSLQGVFGASSPITGQAPIYDEPALQADEAFVYEAIGLSPDTILARFTPQPGYYLYRDKFAFRVAGDSGFEVREVKMPPGKIKDDPEFGPVEVYFDQIEIPILVNRPAGQEQTITLEADYQGCRDGEICYPPQTNRVDLLMTASAEAIQLALPDRDLKPAGSGLDTGAVKPSVSGLPVSEQGKLAQMLLNNPAGALFAFFIAGLLLAFTPCVFPMVPILAGIIAGQGEQMTTIRSFWLSLVYVLAMAVTYTVAGVLAGLFGQNLQAVFQNPWILSFFIAIFIALALSMFGFYELQLPGRFKTPNKPASKEQHGGSQTGVSKKGLH
jgi:thiol:disulfide interchange protein DsbD